MLRLLLSCVLLASASLGLALDAPARAKALTELAAASGEADRLSRLFNLVHEVAAPCVVAIHTREREQSVDPFRRRIVEREVEVGEGSGFVFASDAKQSWIITNAHVVYQQNGQGQFVRGRSGQAVGYDRLRVVFTDNREVDAAYVGGDEQSDLAVLSVPIPNLPVLELADSDQTRVGDWVVALGHPLGVGYSLTAGIVSATDRSTGIYQGVGGFESFIQTDAAINPGNSGGPLVDLRGRVVGVNANILSRTGSNIGLGFAIPANLVRRVADDLKASGKVTRAIVGIQMAELSADEAKKLGLPAAQAVRIGEVIPLSPAADAGLLPGDIILAVRALPIRSLPQFRARIAAQSVGSTVELRIWRDGKERTAAITLLSSEVLEQRLAAAAKDQAKSRPAARAVHLKDLGLHLDDDDGQGLSIIAIDPGSLADQAGLVVGDRLLHERSLGPIRTREDASQLAGRRELVIQIGRPDGSFWLRLRSIR